jgi:hypothetical protein
VVADVQTAARELVGYPRHNHFVCLHPHNCRIRGPGATAGLGRRRTGATAGNGMSAPARRPERSPSRVSALLVDVTPKPAPSSRARRARRARPR